MSWLLLLNFFINGPTALAAVPLEIQYVEAIKDPKFAIIVEQSIAQILEFSKNHRLGIQDKSQFVRKVVLYGSKTAFDKMIVASLDWPKNALVPQNYVGVGQKSVFHVVTWNAYQKIHPQDSLDDYKKLLIHELTHLFHIAYLKGDEQRMGPMWFFEGFACMVANQYLDESLPAPNIIKDALHDPKRGNYRTYAVLVRTLSSMKTIADLLNQAADPDFPSSSERLLVGQQ